MKITMTIPTIRIHEGIKTFVYHSHISLGYAELRNKLDTTLRWEGSALRGLWLSGLDVSDALNDDVTEARLWTM